MKGSEVVDGIIEILCNADFPHIDMLRRSFTLEDMELLASHTSRQA